MTMMMMTLTSAGRQGMRVNHWDHWWPAKNHTRRAQFTPRSTGSYQPSTSLDRRRELCWATACWTGLLSRRGRYMRRGCRGDWWNPTGTERGLWLCRTFATSKRPQHCSSGNCLSRGWWGRSPRTSRQTCGSSQQQYCVSRKQRRPTWSGCLITPTCVPFTPGESPSCQRISSWPDKSEESKHRVPPPKPNIWVLFRTTPILQKE